MATDDDGADPRIYLAAERTFLAWIRTGLKRQLFVAFQLAENGGRAVCVWGRAGGGNGM